MRFRSRARGFAAAIFLFSAALAAGPAPARGDSRGKSDLPAVQVAEMTWQAMGGDEAWNRARFLRFSFIVEKGGKTLASYRHAWDRFTGRYRLEGTTKDGKAFLVLFNVNDRTGRAWLDGKPVLSSEAEKMLEHAYARYINDTYWFLMPYKMRDPGVLLGYEGMRTDEKGKKWEVVRLSFQTGTGLTSGDHYRAYFDPESHLMGRWDYELEGEDHEKGSWEWTEWQKIGPLLLCPDKREIGGDTWIRTPIETVSETVDESAFQAPQ